MKTMNLNMNNLLNMVNTLCIRTKSSDYAKFRFM